MSAAAPSATASRLSGGESRDLVGQVLERPGPGALLGLLVDLAVDQRHHRLDGEQRPEQRPGPADAPALLEVLEGVDDAVHRGAGDEVGDPGLEGVEVGAGRGLLGGVEAPSARGPWSPSGCRRPGRRCGRPPPWPRPTAAW